MVLTHLVRRGGAPGAAGRIGEAARRDGARLRAGPQHGSGAGRGGAGRGAPAGAVRSGKARRGRRGGREGVPAARASIGHTARIRRPRRSCSSAQCATVGRRARARPSARRAHFCTVRPPRASIGTRASVSPCVRFCAGSTERICWPVSVVRGARLYAPLCAHHMSTCAVRNVKHG